MLSLIVLSALSLAEEIDQAKLNALRQYQRERLELSSEVNIKGGDDGCGQQLSSEVLGTAEAHRERPGVCHLAERKV